MDTEDKARKITKENVYTGFRVLFGYLGSYKKQITLLSFMGIISAVGNGIVPYIAGKFFDAIISTDTVTLLNYTVYFYVAILAVWAIVQCVTYFVDWRIGIMSEYLSNVIWIDYVSHGFTFLFTLPMSFHKKHKIGEIGNKINQAAGALETIAGRVFIELAPQLLSIIIAFTIAFIMQPLLAGFLLIGVIVYVFVLVRKVKPLAGYQKEYYDVISSAFGDAYDSIGNTMAIKQASAESHEKKRISTKMKSAVPLWMRLMVVWSTLNMYQRMTILATQIFVFVVSAMYIRGGTMTLGELLAFNAYASMMFGPFVTIARNWQTIHNGVVNIQETEKILSLETEQYEKEGSKKLEINGDISFKNVNFSYEEGKEVLHNITFDAKAGQVIALVGESGVGKTTMIDLVSAYHFPVGGSIMVDGHDIQDVNLKSLRSQIAVVPQEVVLFNDTIINNIRYGRFEATDEEIKAAAEKAHAVEFIEKFPEQWNQIVGERGVKLSVGQKQRVSIARAILRNPRILILDEPTSALDASSEHVITHSLEELMKGKTTFIIAHRLSTVRRADKILVFKEGRIIESGTHTELLQIENGEYKRLYELQIGLHG